MTFELLSSISVEPMLGLYYIAASITSLAGTNLLLQKACSPQTPLQDDSSCDEVAAQKLVTTINTWRPVVEYSIPVVIILLAGAWSDTHGKRRRPLMVLPVAGDILIVFFLLGAVYHWEWSPESTALVESTIRGLSGGRTCFSIGAVTYIADHTVPDQRTFRLAVVTAMIFIASPIGNALGGYLRASYGFYKVFLLSLILNILALLVGLLLLKNRADENLTEKSCGCSEVTKTWRTIFKPRTGYKRAILLLMIVVSPLFGGCLMGEYSVLYFYLRYTFHWGEADYGFYSAFRMSLTFFGTLISIGVLSKLFRLSDAVIGLIATTSQLVAALASASTRYSWQMFLYPAVDLMHGAIYTVGHSIVSKVVEPSDLGQVNSVLGAVDSLVPLVVLPVYNKIYNLTFQVYPGMFFLISAALASVTWFIFLVVILLQARQRTKVHVTIN